MASYHQHRASCLINLTQQVLPPVSENKYKGNIQRLPQDISDKNLLPLASDNTTLRNSTIGRVATGEERQHLMTFRTVGQEEYNNHLKFTYTEE